MNNIAHCFVYFSTEPNGGLQLYNYFYSMRCLLSSDLSTLKNSVLKYLYNVIISCNFTFIFYSFIHSFMSGTALRALHSAALTVVVILFSSICQSLLDEVLKPPVTCPSQNIYI